VLPKISNIAKAIEMTDGRGGGVWFGMGIVGLTTIPCQPWRKTACCLDRLG